MFKKIIVIICMVLINNVSFAAPVNEKFLGRWCWDLSNNEHAFSLTIEKLTNKYQGGYGSVVDFGAIIDDNDNAFTFKQIENDRIKTKIKSSINGSEGVIHLKLLKNNKMEWVITHKSKGAFYVPSKAILHQCE